MKITNYVPVDWKDLQNQVCRLLNEAGYTAESPKEIMTVRGKVEVDVYATSNTELIKQFICECKYWNTPVPKEKIHAFRTVVHDSGSMVGIFISKEGYQSGAYDAAYCSNVLLKTWDEFLVLIEKQWFVKQLINIKKKMHPLAVYTDPLDVQFEKLSVEDRKKYIKLNEVYVGFFLACKELTMSSMKEETISIGANTFSAWDDLFMCFENVISEGIENYEFLFRNHPIAEWKFVGWQHMLFDDTFDNIFDKIFEL